MRFGRQNKIVGLSLQENAQGGGWWEARGGAAEGRGAGGQAESELDADTGHDE